MFNINEIPKMGYNLPKWNLFNQYRATALAYMERENEIFVSNSDGKEYSLAQIKNAIIK